MVLRRLRRRGRHWGLRSHLRVVPEREIRAEVGVETPLRGQRGDDAAKYGCCDQLVHGTNPRKRSEKSKKAVCKAAESVSRYRNPNGTEDAGNPDCPPDTAVAKLSAGPKTHIIEP